jgi:hypothetical protein
MQSGNDFYEQVDYCDDSTVNTIESSVNDNDNENDSPTNNRHIKKISINRSPDCYKIHIPKRIKRRKKGKVIYQNKNMPVYFYETPNTPGATIRDAITGAYNTGFYVGKNLHEDQFYKTAYCIGDALKPGEKIGDNRNPQILFYMNPENYERHFNVNMDLSRKEEWYNKQIQIQNDRTNQPDNDSVVIR